MNLSQLDESHLKIFQGYFDVPYVDYGRSKEGCDCWGLVCLMYEDILGVKLDTYDGDYEIHDEHKVAELISTEKTGFTQVDVPEYMDIVVIRLMGFPWHCGVYLGYGLFIHTQRNTGVCIENLTNKKWKNRVDGFFRV